VQELRPEAPFPFTLSLSKGRAPLQCRISPAIPAGLFLSVEPRNAPFFAEEGFSA
jgi:hypothetical protein